MSQVEVSQVEPTLIQKETDDFQFLAYIGQPVSGVSLLLKRVFDLIVGLVGTILSAPIILLFAIMIKTTSKGPALFKQERVGRMGKPFKVIKLRSMRQDAEAKTGAIWTQKDDPRITPIGRFMRRTRIDELPQFWNVLKGEMSIVGPRPERPILTEKFTSTNNDFAQRLRIIPGITGYAQINGGYEISPDEKCALDNYYIEHYSLWFDVRILFGTMKIVLTGAGAR